MVSWKYYGQRTIRLVAVLCLLFISFIYLYNYQKRHSLGRILQRSSQKFPSTCDLKWFKRELRLDSDPPVIPTELLSECTKIIYNRIPKCGSRTFRDVFEMLSEQHNFTHIYIDQDWWALTDGNYEEAYIDKMQKTNGRFILTSHFYFHEFTKLYDPDTVIYIDISREPTSWFESVYSWNKYGSVERPFGVGRQINTRETLADCVQRQQGCVNDLLYAGTLRFLCGNDDICQPKNYNEDSVSRAWQNVEDHYLVIGMLEDIPVFMEALEFLLPHMFSGIKNAYSSVAETASRRSVTLHKELLDNDSRKMLRSQLQYEYMLYTRLRDQFYQLVAAIQKLKLHSSE